MFSLHVCDDARHQKEMCGLHWTDASMSLTLTSMWGKGPLEFSGTLMGGMTQSLFCRLSPLAEDPLWCFRENLMTLGWESHTLDSISSMPIWKEEGKKKTNNSGHILWWVTLYLICFPLKKISFFNHNWQENNTAEFFLAWKWSKILSVILIKRPIKNVRWVTEEKTRYKHLQECCCITCHKALGRTPETVTDPRLLPERETSLRLHRGAVLCLHLCADMLPSTSLSLLSLLRKEIMCTPALTEAEIKKLCNTCLMRAEDGFFCVHTSENLSNLWYFNKNSTADVFKTIWWNSTQECMDVKTIPLLWLPPAGAAEQRLCSCSSWLVKKGLEGCVILYGVIWLYCCNPANPFVESAPCVHTLSSPAACPCHLKRSQNPAANPTWTAHGAVAGAPARAEHKQTVCASHPQLYW